MRTPRTKTKQQKRPPSKPRWPDYLTVPKDDIFALGVISLKYGQLERTFRDLFEAATGMSEAQVAALFPRIPNDVRQKILEQLLAQSNLPAGLKGYIKHFAKGFTICAHNRHELVHSHFTGHHWCSPDVRGVLLAKFTRAGERVACPVTLSALREIADAIHLFDSYGEHLKIFTWKLRMRRESKIPDPEHVASSEKPPLPRELHWRSLEALQDEPPPLQSFQA